MKVIITKDYDELSSEAFKIVLDVVKNKPNAVLGLAAGGTPMGLYRLMAISYQCGISYANIKTINVAEYVGLGRSHFNSYSYFMQENLFDKIDILKENTYIPNGMAKDLMKECAYFNSLLKEMPQDVHIIGLGSNGHIAFNEPGTNFKSLTHVVNLSESTISDNSRFFDSIDEVPTKAITLGIDNIMNAKKIVILVCGKKKAEAVKRLVEGPVEEDLPASILQTHSDCTLICDFEAASLLKK